MSIGVTCKEDIPSPQRRSCRFRWLESTMMIDEHARYRIYLAFDARLVKSTRCQGLQGLAIASMVNFESVDLTGYQRAQCIEQKFSTLVI